MTFLIAYGIASLIATVLILILGWRYGPKDRQPVESKFGPWLTDPLETLFSWPARVPDHERHA